MFDKPYGEHLPIFPMFHSAPSEDRLERVIERLVDRADWAWLAGKATDAQYDAWHKRLDEWADEQR